jgi:hypothetical protein
MNRRHAMKLAAAVVVGMPLGSRAQDQTAPASSTFVEEQSGDPDLPSQTLTVDLQAVEPLLNIGKSIGVNKDAKQLAKRTVEIATNDSKQNPHPDVQLIEEYLSLFGVPLRDVHGNVQPFCAAGLSHAFCRAYCELTPDKLDYPEKQERANIRVRILRDVLADLNKFYFLPHCATQQMVLSAKQRNIWIPDTPPRAGVMPGWLVFFNWPDKHGRRNGLPNHVGLIEEATSAQLKTIEYNTAVTKEGNQREGGHIAPRCRDYDSVLGYIRTY